MASNLGDLIVRLSLDSSAFEGSITKFETQMKKLGTQFKSTTTGITDFDKVIDKLKTSAETLTGKLDAHKTKLADLERQYKESAAATGEDSEQTKRLGEELNKTKGDIENTERALAAVNGEIKKNESSLYQFGTNMANAGKKVSELGTNMAKVGKNMTLKITTPIVGLGTAAVKAGMDFETAFTGVTKTVDATDEEFAQLSDGLRKLALEIPVPVEGLAEIMEKAGQLGVRGVSALQNFTRTVADLEVSTDLSRDAASEMIAQYANITGMSIERDVDNLGSALVALGNNFAGTEPDILAMSTRLAAAGSQAKISDANILALGTALVSVGLNAEAGGTAFSKLMINMQVASDTGLGINEILKSTGMSLRELEMMADRDAKGFKTLAHEFGMTSGELKNLMNSSKDLKAFGEVAGMTGKEFSKAFKEDAPSAIMEFLRGLKSIEENGGSVLATLDEMGIREVRLRDTILRAVGATDLMAAAMDLANEEWEANTALTEEAEKRYATFASQLELLKSHLKELGISFSEIIIPALLGFMEKLKGAIDWVRGLSDGQKQLIVTIAAVVAAIGPAILVIGKIITAIGAVMQVLGPIIVLVGKAGAAIAAIANPIGIAIAAVAAITAAFAALVIKNETVRNKIIEIGNGIKNFFASWGPAIANVISNAWNGITSFLTGAMNGIKNMFTAVWNAISGFIGAISSAIGGAVKSAWDGIKSAITNIMNAIKSTITNIWNGIKTTVASVVEAVKSTVTNVFNGLKTTVTNVWNGIRDEITKPINAARDAVKAAIDKIKGFFDFKFQWPHIPKPKFSIIPDGWKIGDLLKGVIPKLDITWHAQGGVMTRPTIFGMNPTTGTLMGGGEAGPEAIAPIDTLQKYIRQAVGDANDPEATSRILELLERYLPALAELKVILDSGALVGQLAPAMDGALGSITARRDRGLALT